MSAVGHDSQKCFSSSSWFIGGPPPSAPGNWTLHHWPDQSHNLQWERLRSLCNKFWLGRDDCKWFPLFFRMKILPIGNSSGSTASQPIQCTGGDYATIPLPQTISLTGHRAYKSQPQTTEEYAAVFNFLTAAILSHLGHMRANECPSPNTFCMIINYSYHVSYSFQMVYGLWNFRF